MKHLLVTILLTVFSASLSHAGLSGSSTYEECVLENSKSAQTKDEIELVKTKCQDKIPETIKAALSKLSRGMKSDLVCTGSVYSYPFTLRVDPISKLVVLNKTRNGNITKRTAEMIYGTVEDKNRDEASMFFELNLIVGTLTIKSKLGQPRDLFDFFEEDESSQMECTEEK